MDISAMRGMARSRQDLLQFRLRTREAGVRLRGGIAANAVHQNDKAAWEPWDEDFLCQMADGGLYLTDSGDAQRGREVASMCARTPQSGTEA
jgi:hypothetical protein